VTSDSILSNELGLQFVIPQQLPTAIDVVTRGNCYLINLTREIEWTVDPIVVPAGQFMGCFKYTSSSQHGCDNGGAETIVEEVYIKPGVGIVKITQIKSSECTGECSSRWELLDWDLQ
jgi:hypothetical protein